MPRVRRRNAYHHSSDFYRSRIVIYRENGLSQRSVAAHVGSISHDCLQNMESLSLGGSYGTPQHPSINNCPRRQTSYSHDFHSLYSHVTNSQSKNEVIWKTTGVYRNSSTMFAAGWNGRHASTTLDATSQKAVTKSAN